EAERLDVERAGTLGVGRRHGEEVELLDEVLHGGLLGRLTCRGPAAPHFSCRGTTSTGMSLWCSSLRAVEPRKAADTAPSPWLPTTMAAAVFSRAASSSTSTG